MASTVPTAVKSVGELDSRAGGLAGWRAIDWRDHQRWVMVEGRPVNVVELGSGPPVVFVHGWDGSWVNWLENLPYFARHHRVIALDLPGFGASPMPREEISITGYARIVDGLLEALGVERAAVVGNSMGGFISAEVALRHAARVERLVLVSAAGLAIEKARHRPLTAAVRALSFIPIALGTRSEAVARRPRLRRWALGAVAARPSELDADFALEQFQGQGKKGHVPAFMAMVDYAFRDRLGEISVPTLIVWGDRDRLVPVSDADEFERLIPDSRKIVYEGRGHCPMFEEPERFHADVSDFLGVARASSDARTSGQITARVR